MIVTYQTLLFILNPYCLTHCVRSLYLNFHLLSLRLRDLALLSIATSPPFDTLTTPDLSLQILNSVYLNVTY